MTLYFSPPWARETSVLRDEGELHASTVVIAEDAHMEGDVVAEELTIGGHHPCQPRQAK
jgi:hypothetical protein